MEIFKRKFSELSGGRFDPLYLLFNTKEFLKKTPFELKFLGSLIKDIKTGFAAGKDNQENFDSGILQIRPTNLDENGVLKFDKNIYVPQNIEKEHLLQKGEVLFNNTNSQELVGKSAYFNLSGNFVSSNHITRIQTNTALLLPQYLCIVLNIYQKNKVFFNTCVNWNNQSGINVDFLKKYQIPLPPIPTQEKIIALMDKAYQQKEAKEKEAKALLNSIDSYLMQELGIKLPNNNYTSLKQRIFTQKLSKVSSTRLDPNYHQSYYQDLEKALSQSAYPLVNLSQIIKSFQKGVEVGSKAYSKNNKIPFIRVSDIDNNGINYDKVEKFIAASLYENLKEFKPKKDELLYSKDGTIGICLKADTSRDFIISSAILRLKFEEKINIDFAQNILASHLMNVLANAKAIGAVIKHLNIGEFLSLKIPLPPLEVQNALASHLETDKQKAKTLKAEAQTILKSAKIDIEKCILSSGGGALIVKFSFDDFEKTLCKLSFNAFEFETNLKNAWQGGRYKVKALKNFILKSISGVWGYDKNEVSDFSKYEKCLIIRSTEFDNNFGINLNSNRVKYRYIEKEQIEKLCINEGDILIEKSGGSENQPVGRVVYITKELLNMQICFSNFIQKITLNNEALKEYIYHYLGVIHSYKMTQKFQSQTNGIRNLIMQEYLNLKIPLPPLEIQKQIATQINKRKEKAKNLQVEAKALLQNAKKEVKKIILGG